MSEKEIRETIKAVYTQLAESSPHVHEHEEESCASCGDGCGGGCSCGCGEAFDPMDVARELGYSDEELEAVPEESVLGLGCGNPVGLASVKPGETVLDLGSGAGVDVFLASKRVGASGKAIGVDINEAMVGRARSAAEAYGFGNVEFRLGEMENIPVGDSSVDAVISNCVINLSLDKPRVFREALRVLKPGGRLVVSDMVTVGGLPEDVRGSAEAWASCISGAEEREAYVRLISEAGFRGVKVLKDVAYQSDYEDLNEKIHSVTVEAWK